MGFRFSGGTQSCKLPRGFVLGCMRWEIRGFVSFVGFVVEFSEWHAGGCKGWVFLGLVRLEG